MTWGCDGLPRALFARAAYALRGARLDPGSALRAVRDDVEKKGAVRDDKEGRVTKMRGMT